MQAAPEKLKQHPEPDAGYMLVRQTVLPAYNVQTSVDAEHALIVAHAVVLDAFDIRCLKPMAEAAKKALEVDNFKVVADAGYSNGEQVAHCEAAGMLPYVPVMRTVNNQGDGTLFGRAEFRYDPDSDTYVCPGDKRLLRKHTNHKDRYTMYKASSGDCGTCSLKSRCTQAPRRGLAHHLCGRFHAHRQICVEPRMKRFSRLRFCGWCLTLATLLFLETPSALYGQSPHMQIIVERRVGKSVQQMNPQHVFTAGDYVRFRFSSSFDGYLYVTDQSTSGKYVSLFPAAGAAESNEVRRNANYLVPASSGSWFRVDNPPGYETIFFLISRTQLQSSPNENQAPAGPSSFSMPPPPAPMPAPAELSPRCDDALFRARGDCLDVLAGPRSIPPQDNIPAELPHVPASSSRDVTVINKPTSSVIAPDTSGGAPLIYEFRLAHR